MEEMHPRCAGIDIGKKFAKVCVRTPGVNPHSRRAKERISEVVTTWGSMTNTILALREHLIEQQVTLVLMEATSDYLKPYYYLLEDLPGCEVMLVNARHVKNVPGRKTDVNDATWLAQLGAHGLVRPSLVPPPAIRELRDLTRTRSAVTRERSREVLRMKKLLEGAGIKLSSVASDLTGVSARAMLNALCAGERNPEVLADLAHWSMRGKSGELIEALTGRFSDHHSFLVRTHFDLIDKHDQVISEITERIEAMIEPFRDARTLISSIPGISNRVAEVIIAETGADMSRFPSLLGRSLPGQQRVGWSGEVQQDHPRQRPPQRRPGHRRIRRIPDQEHLPSRQVPTHRSTSRQETSRRCAAARHAQRDLAHAPDRRALQRPRRRLLHHPAP